MGQNEFGDGSMWDTLNTRNYDILGKSEAGCDEISGIQADLMSFIHYDDRFYNEIL